MIILSFRMSAISRRSSIGYAAPPRALGNFRTYGSGLDWQGNTAHGAYRKILILFRCRSTFDVSRTRFIQRCSTSAFQIRYVRSMLIAYPQCQAGNYVRGLILCMDARGSQIPYGLPIHLTKNPRANPRHGAPRFTFSSLSRRSCVLQHIRHIYSFFVPWCDWDAELSNHLPSHW